MSGALDRIKARQTAYPNLEGTFLHDAFAPVAGELDMMTDEYIPAALAAVLPDTAISTDLDLVASAYGLERKPATKATGVVVFTGDEDAEIAADLPVSTASGKVYLTTESAVIPAEGSVPVPVIASQAGGAYNVGIGSIAVIPITLVGVDSVTNPAVILGGADIESDSSLRDRLLMRIRLPAASGCEADYIRWAREVPGIAGAACIPIWDGAGTVKVIVAGEGMAPVGASTLEAVETYIETMRPIGAEVTVTSVTSLDVDVSATLVLKTGYTLAGVQEAVESALAAVIDASEFGATELPIAHIGAALLSVPGVHDYSDLELNGFAVNVDLTSEQVPELGTVTLA